MNLTELFSRWRHTKGYGVHSPLAFRLVTHVVRPRRDVIYYGEERLDASSLPYREIRRARILLRLVAELQPSYVWGSPDLPQIYADAIRLAGCVVRVYDGELYPDDFSKADLIVLNDFKPKKAEFRKMLAAGKSLIAFDVKPKVVEWACQLLKGGVLLEAGKSLIAVSTRDEAAHIYRISKF